MFSITCGSCFSLLLCFVSLFVSGRVTESLSSAARFAWSEVTADRQPGAVPPAGIITTYLKTNAKDLIFGPLP